MAYWGFPESAEIRATEMGATFTVLIGVGASVVGAVLSYVVSYVVLRLQRKRLLESSTTEGRISSLISSLNRSADTLSESITALSEIEDEMGKKRLLADKLQREIDHSTRIAALTRKEVDAVAHVMGRIVRREGKHSFWKSLLVNFLFYTAGVITTILLAQVVR